MDAAPAEPLVAFLLQFPTGWAVVRLPQADLDAAARIGAEQGKAAATAHLCAAVEARRAPAADKATPAQVDAFVAGREAP